MMTRVVAALCLFGAACATGPEGARSVLPRIPSDLARCRVAVSQTSPLVTEWPGSEKANLEVLLRSGVVAVAYSGCNLRVLPDCRVPGGYQWQRTTPATDAVEINDADELYTKLPLGAASLEGELKRSGKLTVKTVVSGQLRLDKASAVSVPTDGACLQATHLVTALSVGAFALTADGARSGHIGANVKIGEAKLQSERSANLLRSAGDFETCGSSTDQSPHANCASPIQVFLTPLPGRAAEEGPPGAVKVDFVSGNPASRWDVYSDDQVICTTPCSRWVQPARPVMLRARDENWMGSPDRVQVANLLDHPGESHLQLRALPTSRGKLVTGITFTAFAGMAVLTGATLTPLGCGSEGRSGFCTAGLITLGVGALALIPSIWLILDALPEAEVTSDHEVSTVFARSRSSQRGVVFGPGIISGTF